MKVYIASPYTLGDIAVNVRFQIDIADQLIGRGLTPFVPLYSHFQHMIHPRPYQTWMNLDKEWLVACDCVFRAGGESAGADEEVALAQKLNIPVFYSFTDLITWYKNYDVKI
jgi:hypothetical protein